MLDSLVPSRARSREAAAEQSDLLRWIALCALGFTLAWLAVRLDARVGTQSPPFTGDYRLAVDVASLAAPLVAAAVVLAALHRIHLRMPWRWLLCAAYLAAAAWALALALVDGTSGLGGPVRGPDEYLVDVPSVGDHPGRFLREFVDRAPELSTATRQHPPLPVLTLWLAGRAGIGDPVAIGVLITLAGSLVAPLVAVAMRSLTGERSARELLPVLVLAPYALWVAVSMEAVVATLGAGMVAACVLASERGRGWGWRVSWSAGAGLLLGAAALFSYSVPWLGVSVMCVYFVRRQPLLNVVTGVCALLPLAAVHLAGFVWTNGLAAARRDFAERVGPQRSAVLWAVLALVVLVVACGPALVASARKLRRTPAWPFLVGAGLGVGFALVTGLARGDVERTWLPFVPWLLVAAVAPQRAGGQPTRAPLLLAATGAACAVALQAVLRSNW